MDVDQNESDQENYYVPLKEKKLEMKSDADVEMAVEEKGEEKEDGN